VGVVLAAGEHAPKQHGELAYAIEHGWRTDNPAESAPKRRESDPQELTVLSVEQLASVAREADDEQTRALIMTAGLTGLRMGELLALRWRDIAWEQRKLVVNRSYTQGIGTNSTKSRKSRSVPLSDQVGAVLDALSRREESLVLSGLEGTYAVPLTGPAIYSS
jgi:integrase